MGQACSGLVQSVKKKRGGTLPGQGYIHQVGNVQAYGAIPVEQTTIQQGIAPMCLMDVGSEEARSIETYREVQDVLPSECLAAPQSKPASQETPLRQVLESIEDSSHASNAPSSEPQHVESSAPGETFQESETSVWHADVCWSLGPTIANPAHGAVQRIEANQSSSVNQTVQMLNSGMISCSAGVCVVYSSSHQAYYMLGRSDKKQDCVQIARDTFHVDVQEPIPETRDAGLSIMGKMSQDAIESGASSTHVEQIAPADRSKTSTSLEVTKSNVFVEQQHMQAVKDLKKDDTDQCEDDVCASSTMDRREWAKTRSLRRSGTTHESQPSQSCADARAEAPVTAFATLGA